MQPVSLGSSTTVGPLYLWILYSQIQPPRSENIWGVGDRNIPESSEK